MASAKLRVKVVTPTGSLVDREAAAVTAVSEVGEFCVLPEHRPILAALHPGRLVVEDAEGGRADYALDRGFAEGGPDHVSVITQRCVPAAEIDAEAVGAERADLERRLAELEEGDASRDAIRADLAWAEARLAVAK